MIRSDFHLHSNYCDGKDTPETIILSAIDKGMDTIGFSGHGYLFIDDCCMSENGTEEYKAEIARLKNKYKDQIRIFCGVEQDYYSVLPTNDYDYVIGSLHYIQTGNSFLSIDFSFEQLMKITADYFNGDIYSVAEEYYSRLAEIVEVTKCDIIGHFDLISKFNEDGSVFNPNNERYISAWQKAADKLLTYSVPFEVNTGAISRGYRNTPYPSMEMIDYLASHGGKFVLSSDSHAASTLMYQFDKWENVLVDKGIDLIDNFR